MNRRNVLVGLGTIVAGGGAALGTGAFSSVEATREVSVETAGDEGALLGLNITSDTLAGEDGDTIMFDLDDDTGVNLDAVTRFDGAFEITNNSENEISIEIEDADETDLTSEGTGLYFDDNDDDEDLGVLSSGGTLSLDVVFDLEGETSTETDLIPGEITITAEQIE